MNKYWALDLTFLKSEGTTIRNYESSIVHLKRKEFVVYKVDQCVESKVISKKLDCDIYDESNGPFQHLEIKRRFIIPSEVIISKEYLLRNTCYHGKILEETRIESVAIYVVDRNGMFLKPSKIIYYICNSTHSHLLSAKYCEDFGWKYTSIIYDPSRNKYKYYDHDDFEEENCNFRGVEAKQKIEDKLFEYELEKFNVTPIENIETAFQTT